MSDEKALTTTNQASALDVYGSGDDIKTLARRIKLCLPGGDKLQEHDALALAQLSVAYGLNPFNGEVWIIVDKSGASRGTMVGIKGLRKAARRQGNYWPVFSVLGREEKKEIGIPDNAIAYRCLIYRTDLLRQSAEAIDLMRKAGMVNAHEIYAYKPAEGIGYATPGEFSKMKDDQRARKRSEAEALKVAFDLPFQNEIGTNGDRIGYVDAEEWEVQDAAPKLTGEALQDRMAENVKILRGNPDDPDPLGIDAAGPAYDSPAFKAGEEPPDLDAVFPREAPPKSGPIPCEPSKFFAAVNKETNFYYKNLSHLLNALKEKTWPGPKDAAAWADYYRRAIAHAEAKHGITPDATETSAETGQESLL